MGKKGFGSKKPRLKITSIRSFQTFMLLGVLILSYSPAIAGLHLLSAQVVLMLGS